MSAIERKRLRERRKKRTRKQLSRTDDPLLTIFRTSKHIYAQLVDPHTGRTLTSTSSRTPAVRSVVAGKKGREAAAQVGTHIAELARERQISKVAFNRNGFVFTGRIKALADAAREAGLKF